MAKTYCEKALESLVSSIRLTDAMNTQGGGTVDAGRNAIIPGSSWALAFQDVLRFISLWFEFGNYPDIASNVDTWKDQIRVEYWLLVIPQLIARIDTTKELVAEQLKTLLKKIGARFLLNPHPSDPKSPYLSIQFLSNTLPLYAPLNSLNAISCSAWF